MAAQAPLLALIGGAALAGNACGIPITEVFRWLGHKSINQIQRMVMARPLLK